MRCKKKKNGGGGNKNGKFPHFCANQRTWKKVITSQGYLITKKQPDITSHAARHPIIMLSIYSATHTDQLKEMNIHFILFLFFIDFN